MKNRFKVGDKLKMVNNPYDEQIEEEREKFDFMKDKTHTVTDVMETEHLKGTFGQWIKTDLETDWLDSVWFKLIK